MHAYACTRARVEYTRTTRPRDRIANRSLNLVKKKIAESGARQVWALSEGGARLICFMSQTALRIARAHACSASSCMREEYEASLDLCPAVDGQNAGGCGRVARG